MIITICSVTFKPLLLVLTSLCLCVQALGNSASHVTISSEQQKEDQVYIEAFRAFASEDRFVRSIRRYQGTDQVIERKHAVTLVHRLLTIFEYVSTNQTKLSINNCKKWQTLLDKVGAIPSIKKFGKIEEDDMEQMYKDVYDPNKDETNVLQKYCQTVIEKQMGAKDAIESSIENDPIVIQNNKLANHILPFMRQMYKYDEAIDYITSEHQSHCVKGVVQEYRSYYRVLWWNSLRMRTGAVNVVVKQVNVRLWTVFMATACPLLDNDHDKQESMFRDLQSEAPLNFVDYDKVLELPSQMESLLPEMTMVKGLKTIGELIEALVNEFNRYSQKSESSRVEHDDHLWKGYQKKFIVQQTIIRVMRKDLETAQTYLKEQMSKFKEWIANKGISANAIPEQTVALVWTALSQSDTFQRLPEPTKLTILESVLMLMFEHNSVTFPTPKAANTIDALKNVKVNFPSKLRIFCEFCQDTNRLSTGHLVSSKAMDKLVGFYVEKMKNNAHIAVIPDSLTLSVRNRRLTEVVTMILPQLSAKFGQVEEENVTKGCCFGGVVNCPYEHSCYSALFIGIIVVAALFKAAWIIFNSSTIPCPTTTTEVPSNHWFPPILTNVLIIVMIVLICVFLFMIYQHRKSQSRSTSKAEKKNNKNKRKVVGKHIRGPEKIVRRGFKSGAQSSAAGSSSSSFLSSASSSNVASSASSALSSVISGQSSAVSGGSKVSKHTRGFKLSPQVGKSPRGAKSPPPDTKHRADPKANKRKGRKK